jgi:hypothetical protein
MSSPISAHRELPRWVDALQTVFLFVFIFAGLPSDLALRRKIRVVGVVGGLLGVFVASLVRRKASPVVAAEGKLYVGDRLLSRSDVARLETNEGPRTCRALLRLQTGDSIRLRFDTAEQLAMFLSEVHIAPDARRLRFVPPNPWLAACVIVSVVFSVLVAAAFRTGVKSGDLVQLSVSLVAIVPLTLISMSLYTAYVAITSNALRVRLGWFVRSIARAEIQHAELTSSGIVLRHDSKGCRPPPPLGQKLTQAAAAPMTGASAAGAAHVVSARRRVTARSTPRAARSTMATASATT